MRTTTIRLKGTEFEIEYTDHGYESDTNAHEIEWSFTDPLINELLTLTEEDEESVLTQLVARTEEEL